MADNETGLIADAKDLVTTLRDYAKQETVGPLKGLGRYLAWGVAGAVLMALAVILLVLSGIRAMQSELSAFDGNWSFAPYFIGCFALLVVLGLAGRAVALEKGDG
jgi:hypothetical protein